jgi:hypothetical protein
MPSRLIRPLLVVEFLIAIQVWLTFWSQVGGQYHLDLMFWPWKFVLTVAAAWLTTAITLELLRSVPEQPEQLSRRGKLYSILLVVVMLVAGAVTYYYHLNEPADEDNGGDPPTSQTTSLRDYQTRQAFAETIGLPVAQPKAF